MKSLAVLRLFGVRDLALVVRLPANLSAKDLSSVEALASVGRFALVFLFFFFTFSIFNYQFSIAHASPGPPNPQPCRNALETSYLTDNWITDSAGNPPINRTLTYQGTPGQQVTVSLETAIQVDFSALQAIFAASNSDYLEGRFQDQNHRSAKLTQSTAKDLNQFFGPSQKSTPKVVIDTLKTKYVEYVYNKPELPEAQNTYTDINGQGQEKTIFDLVGEFGLPQPPDSGENRDTWSQAWGLYWPKIPTSYSEFYKGELQFRIAAGQSTFDEIEKGNLCPFPLRTIQFVMPEFFRTTAASGQLNQVVVPKVAQSQVNNPILRAADDAKNALAQFVHKCLQIATNNPITKNLAKTVKISLEKFSLVKNVYAQESCVKIVNQGKTGNGPFCALPAGQLSPGDFCTGQTNPNQLDPNNPNVICSFRVSWQTVLTIGNVGPEGFDSCTDDDGDGVLACTLRVGIWPVFRIPYLAEIWNNTLYSDQADQAGIGSQQKTGRPGIYSAFTPKVVFEQFQGLTEEQIDAIREACVRSQSTGDPITTNECLSLLTLFARLAPNSSCDPGPRVIDLLRCLGTVYSQITKKLPGQVGTSPVTDLKERFIGATDCSKNFVRDFALKPKIIRQILGIQSYCQFTP